MYDPYKNINNITFPATNVGRTTTKSSALTWMDIILQENVWMSGFVLLLIDPLMNFFNGIFNRLYS